MGEVWFYHLTSSPLEATLPVLLRRALAAGWRVVVRGANAQRLEWLDQRLWLGERDEFLPHGLAGGPHDARQPVLLTTQAGRPNAAQCLMAVDGATVEPAELADWSRACLLFDGNDDSALELARTQWRLLRAAGAAAQYWSEASGRWERKGDAAG